MSLDALFEQRFQCPYCGETISVVLDLSAGQQVLIEDCQICCRPIQLCYQLLDDDRIWFQSERTD